MKPDYTDKCSVGDDASHSNLYDAELKNYVAKGGNSLRRKTEMKYVNLVAKGRDRKRMRTKWPLDFTEGRDVQNRKGDLPYWTPHMNTFYNYDCSDDFDLETVLTTQSSEKWDLITEEFPSFRDYHRKKTCKLQRCLICWRCDNPTNKRSGYYVCKQCGSFDHSSRFACPNNCCYRCGGDYHKICSQTTACVTCSICHQKGHTKEICPDIWRRYCYTTTGSEPVQPASTKPEIPLCKLCCFHCAEAGHIASDCESIAGDIANENYRDKFDCEQWAYRIVSVFPYSYDLPVENELGKDILIESEEKEEEEEPSQYEEVSWKGRLRQQVPVENHDPKHPLAVENSALPLAPLPLLDTNIQSPKDKNTNITPQTNAHIEHSAVTLPLRRSSRIKKPVKPYTRA